MRLLLILIYTCLYFVAPLQSHAGEVSKKYSYERVDRKTTGAQLSDPSLTSGLCAELTHLNHLRSGSTQIRYAYLVKYFTATATYAYAIVSGKSNHFIPSFLYCKAIGLLLVFPQHYFW